MSTAHEPAAATPNEAVVAPQPIDADTAPIPDRVYRLSIEQYNTMVEAGCFETEELVRPKLELLDGVLTNMSPINAPHANIVSWLNDWLHDSIPRDTHQTRCQCPVLVSSTASVPEPDLSVVRRRQSVRHPEASIVALIVEVADSSLAEDLGQKARIYAGGGVPEYWVVDIPSRRLHVHCKPAGDAYTELRVVEANGEAAPAVAADAVLKLTELFAVLDAE